MHFLRLRHTKIASLPSAEPFIWKMAHRIFLGNKPEYHGNPVSDKGALVTFHYGYDLPELIREWSGMEYTYLSFP